MGDATRTTIAIFGVITALAAVEHGIGEIQQGSTRPEGRVIASWPDSPAFESLSGEPAFTIVPNLQVSGVLTILVAAGFLHWVTLYADRQHGSLVLAGLSAALFLVGGGFGPPLLGAILAAAASRLHSPLAWSRRHLDGPVGHALASSWARWVVAGVVAWLMVLPGIVIVELVVESPHLWVLPAVLTPLAFALLGVSLISALARDLQDEPESRARVGDVSSGGVVNA